MKRRLLIGLLILSLFLVGCATAKVKFQRLDRAYRDIRGVKRVAVLDFQSYGGRLESGRAASDLLISGLLEPGFYEIVERSRIDEVVQEHRFNLSGMVSDSTIRKMGEILGVDAVIFGTVSGYDVETSRGQTLATPGYFDKERGIYVPPTYRNYTIKSGNVAVNYRMIDIETGRVIAAKSISRDFSKKRYDNAFFRLPSDDSILNDLLKKVTSQFVAEISPHYTLQSRKLEKGKRNEGIKKGVKLAKKGLWDEAIEEWRYVAEKEPQNAWVHNNLGIAYEKKGDFAQARKEYKKAIELNPEELRYKRNLENLKTAYDKYRAEYVQMGSLNIVIQRKNNTVYIDLGKEHGVDVGEVFIVYREVAVKHPVTDEVIGTEEEEIGKIKVNKVSEKMSIAEVIKEEPENKIKVKDKVRKRGD
ncbi:tetratricopeptide repeat protein [bacterium]|nr:tetratricopeptide repeat protein [bacterium]MBU4310307.1 tetratricopeptide repeat protein [bacterium]